MSLLLLLLGDYGNKFSYLLRLNKLCSVLFTETNFAKTFSRMSLKVIDGLKFFFVFYALRKNNFALAKKDVKDRI